MFFKRKKTEDNEIVSSKKDIFCSDDFVDPVEFKELYGNPFLHDNNTSLVYADSIEDFAVKYQGEYIYFGSFIRNPNISNFQKLRYTKKYFRKWKHEFKKKYSLLSHRKKNAISSLNEKKITFYNKKLICALILCIVVGIIFFGLLLNPFGFSGYFGRLKTSLISFCSNNIIKLCSIIYVVFFILLLLETLLYFILKMLIITFNRRAKNKISATLKRVDRNFRKSYPKTLRYYLKKIKRKKHFYRPVKLNDFYIVKSSYFKDFDYIENQQNKTNQMLIIINKINKPVRIFTFIISVMSLICLGVIIYFSLKNL